jgi:hypothetical protein
MGVASNSSSNQVETPSHVALAWFKTINANDVRAADKLFAPAQRSQISWMKEPASDQSTFTDVQCHTTRRTATFAAALCTFVESASPTEGQPVSFWSVEFKKGPTGNWLIDNYGQG